jgi:hypothetical protein
MPNVAIWKVPAGQDIATAQLWGSREFTELPRRGEIVQIDDLGNHEVLAVMHHSGQHSPSFVTLFIRPLGTGDFPV